MYAITHSDGTLLSDIKTSLAPSWGNFIIYPPKVKKSNEAINEHINRPPQQNLEMRKYNTHYSKSNI